MYYNGRTKGFRAAIEEGLVLVATPPSHPQVADNILSHLNLKSFQAAAENENDPFHDWKGKGEAQNLVPDVEEEDSSSESSSVSDWSTCSDSDI